VTTATGIVEFLVLLGQFGYSTINVRIQKQMEGIENYVKAEAQSAISEEKKE
jgi:hypothetical protein